jgi:hypothetical protein
VGPPRPSIPTALAQKFLPTFANAKGIEAAYSACASRLASLEIQEHKMQRQLDAARHAEMQHRARERSIQARLDDAERIHADYIAVKSQLQQCEVRQIDLQAQLRAAKNTKEKYGLCVSRLADLEARLQDMQREFTSREQGLHAQLKAANCLQQELSKVVALSEAKVARLETELANAEGSAREQPEASLHIDAQSVRVAELEGMVSSTRQATEDEEAGRYRVEISLANRKVRTLPACIRRVNALQS